MNPLRLAQTHRRIVAWGIPLLLAALLVPMAGCRLLATPILLWGSEPTKQIPAEFPHLQNKKVCTLVWAEMDTLFEYPQVQYELSEHVRAALEGTVPGISFIPNRQVVDFQRRTPEWERSDPVVLGARFGAERVLMIELTQYGTREPDSPHLYRGRISANVKVYNAARPNTAPVYRTVVETVYPPDSVGQWGSDDRSIRRGTMEAFASDVAGKFYDRTVKVE